MRADVLPLNFLPDTSVMEMSDAVAAIIISEDKRYLLQLRDDVPGIFFPGFWGLFGGAISPGERPEEALKRELEEELAFIVTTYRQFCCFDFDLGSSGGPKISRSYFEMSVETARISDFVLQEGMDMRLFTAEEAFDRPNLAPYDSYALWMHVSQARLR